MPATGPESCSNPSKAFSFDDAPFELQVHSFAVLSPITVQMGHYATLDPWSAWEGPNVMREALVTSEGQVSVGNAASATTCDLDGRLVGRQTPSVSDAAYSEPTWHPAGGGGFYTAESEDWSGDFYYLPSANEAQPVRVEQPIPWIEGSITEVAHRMGLGQKEDAVYLLGAVADAYWDEDPVVRDPRCVRGTVLAKYEGSTLAWARVFDVLNTPEVVREVEDVLTGAGVPQALISSVPFSGGALVVDPDDNVYVVSGGHVSVFGPEGSFREAHRFVREGSPDERPELGDPTQTDGRYMVFGCTCFTGGSLARVDLTGVGPSWWREADYEHEILVEAAQVASWTGSIPRTGSNETAAVLRSDGSACLTGTYDNDLTGNRAVLPDAVGGQSTLISCFSEAGDHLWSEQYPQGSRRAHLLPDDGFLLGGDDAYRIDRDGAGYESN